MATFTSISLAEMAELLRALGYTAIDTQSLPGVKEVVYGKILKRDVCLRVYTSIDWRTGQCVDVGGDAIRCCVVKRVKDWKTGKHRIIGIGKTKRVHRVVNWRENLTRRIQSLQEEFAK